MARPGRPTGHPQNFFIVADDGGAEAAGGVDIGVGDGDGGEVDHEDSKPKGLWNQDMNVRISSASLGISGWKKKTMHASMKVPMISAPRAASLL